MTGAWSPLQLTDAELVRLCKLLSGRSWADFAVRVMARTPGAVKGWSSGKSHPPRYLRETLEGIARRAHQAGRVAALLPLVRREAERLEKGIRLSDPPPAI